MLICAAVAGEGVQVAPATLDAINKVLGVLLAASGKQSTTSESAPSAPAPDARAAEMTERGSMDQSYQRFSSAQRVATDRQSSSEPAASEPSKKSFLKVIDHQHQPSSQSSVATDSTDFGRRDEPLSRPPMSTNYPSYGRSFDDVRRLDPADLQRRLDDDRFGGRLAERRFVDDPRDPGRYYGGARRGNEFWNEMSAYCAEYEARVGHPDPLPRPPAGDYMEDLERRRALGAANYPDDMYRRRVQESTAGGREEMEHRYRLAADDWREPELRRLRSDNYPPGPPRF